MLLDIHLSLLVNDLLWEAFSWKVTLASQNWEHRTKTNHTTTSQDDEDRGIHFVSHSLLTAGVYGGLYD